MTVKNQLKKLREEKKQKQAHGLPIDCGNGMNIENVGSKKGSSTRRRPRGLVRPRGRAGYLRPRLPKDLGRPLSIHRFYCIHYDV